MWLDAIHIIIQRLIVTQTTVEIQTGFTPEEIFALTSTQDAMFIITVVATVVRHAVDTTGTHVAVATVVADVLCVDHEAG